ncbi:hypothetical protein [Janthinobacterium rivuli]|uniref:hypothetical protein n=1 Tax=Janthinobacterium sp. FT68W TaxID=2654255 RepID=UPI00186AD134|nr:hypothetical protein [Janthinobacterium sp. FT68W]
MATGRVADHDDAVKIDVNASDTKVRQVVDASGNIVHCCRSPGLRRTQPAVFYIPDGKTVCHQVASDGGHLITTIRHPPKPTVQQANNGRPWCCGKVQIRLPVGGRAIWECLHRGTPVGLFHACFAPSVEPEADINEVDALMPTV